MLKDKLIIDLSTKEKEVLTELSLNGRETLANIAKTLGRSLQAVKYTIESLESKGIIEGYYAIIDTSNLGFLSYRISFKLRDVTKKREKELVNEMIQLENITWLWQEHAENDIVIDITARNPIHLNKLLMNAYKILGSNLEQKKVHVLTELRYLKFDFLNKSKKRLVTTSIDQEPVVSSTDKIDHQLIDLLAFNGRESLVNLGKTLSISPALVKQRVANLIEKKIITGFNVKVNFELLGYSNHIVYLYLSQKDNEKAIIKYLEKNRNIVNIASGIGDADIDFDIQAKSNTELLSFVKELSWKFPNVIKDCKVHTIINEPFRSFHTPK
ncbi:MAG: Lrp/AsnC family transcriptional regulator [Flavobacteriales bacterium]|nr:Lrp/AsnC family transcriptional regulator [Flavobacteriales bacterium]